jgi:hypothetical protein
MVNETTFQLQSRSAKLVSILVAFGLVVLVLYPCAGIITMMYSEWKGPHRSITDVADLDGDGDLDVIVGHTRWESADISWAGITLLINQGDGRFTRSGQELPGGFSAAAGDVDGDGDVDLLILDGYALMLCLNQGGAQGGTLGVFETNNPIRPSSQWRGHADMGGSVILGDLNNDGAVDGFVAGCCYGTGEDPLVASSHFPSSAWVWINEWDPRGWLVRHTLSLQELDGLPMRAAALGDLDGDADLDVFTAIGAPTIGAGDSLDDLVLLNDGAGNLTASDQWQGSSDSTAVALGDVDGDDDLDALVGTKNGATVWINQGGAQGGQEGMFALSEQQIPGGQTGAVFLYDLDGDGDQDALIAGLRQAVIWRNNGQAVFTQSSQRFRYSERDGLAIGDFNDDGSPDVFSGADAETYNVWFNQGDGTFRAGNRR